MGKIKYLSTGNEACGEGAIRAGCRFYAGYPITPQNELTAYMSRRMEEVEGVFIQAESELAAINMVFGAAAAGARAMTSSSSPGISLKQEGISYMAGAEIPGVIVNVMRGGPGLGNIAPSQADYFQATKGGGHGDYNMVVFAPASAQEMFDFTHKAFEVADKYRNPVMILADGMIGQVMEPIEFDENIQPSGVIEKPWAMTGAKGWEPDTVEGREAGSIKSLLLGDDALEKHNEKLQKKFKQMGEAEGEVELYHAEGADIIIVAYGTISRVAKSCVDHLKGKDIKVGLIRPLTLWPFPYEEIKRFTKDGAKFLVAEMSAGQMVEDVRLAVQDDSKVHFSGRTGGGVHTEQEIISAIEKLI